MRSTLPGTGQFIVIRRLTRRGGVAYSNDIERGLKDKRVVLPASDVARMLAVIQAIVGQFYMVGRGPPGPAPLTAGRPPARGRCDLRVAPSA